MKVQFLEYHCSTEWGFYDNSRLALQLIATGEDANTQPGDPIATATVNTGLRIDLDEIVIRDYDETEGMVASLIGAGIVLPVFSPVFVGTYSSRCARCRLTDAARIEAFGLSPTSL